MKAISRFDFDGLPLVPENILPHFFFGVLAHLVKKLDPFAQQVAQGFEEFVESLKPAIAKLDYD